MSSKKNPKKEKTGDPQKRAENGGGIPAVEAVPAEEVLGRLFRPFLVVRNGHCDDEIAGLFEVRLLDEDLELGHPVDGQGIDERGRAAADDGDDTVAFEEVLDQVRFERAEDAGDLDKVFVLRRMAVIVVGHGLVPFLDPR